MNDMQNLGRRLVRAALACLATLPMLAAAQATEWETFEPRPRQHSRLAKPPQTMAIEFSGRRVDPSATWSSLGDEDREAVKKTQMPLLGPGDEPPYPQVGLKPLVERMYRVRGPMNQPLRLYFQIGPMGQVEAVASGGKVSQQFLHELLVMLQNSGYKPGLCAEKVCTRPLALDIVYLGE